MMSTSAGCRQQQHLAAQKKLYPSLLSVRGKLSNPIFRQKSLLNGMYVCPYDSSSDRHHTRVLNVHCFAFNIHCLQE